jgi:hypothetical protein
MELERRMDIEKQNQLIQIQKEIESWKVKKAKYEGKKEELMKQLSDVGCKSIEDVQEKRENLDKEIDVLEKKFESEIEKFMRKYINGEN